MKKINWLKLIVSLVICFGAAGLGSVATASKIQTWYALLNKPFFSPPNWVFGPVWTILYFLMAIAFYKVWLKKAITNNVLKWFWIQLILNTTWSLVFFGAENPGVALIVIGGLWFSIVKMRENFKYQLPYLCWVSFAAILNAAVWWMNR